MNLLHEVEKMDPPLAFRAGEFEKQVHQHRFAATNLAPNVESFFGAFLAPSKNAFE